MRLYGYRFTRTGGVAGAAATSAAEDVRLVESAGWPIRTPEHLTSVEIFERSIAAVSTLDEFAEAWSGGPRSDVTPPLSGWRGGVDESRAEWLLGV